MSSERNWGQVLLIGAGVVAAGGAVWYLYSNQESAPRPQDEEDFSDEAPEFATEHEQQQEADSEPEREPLKNRLPPLPERPPAGKRRTGKASSATSSRQEDNQDAKPSGQAESGRKTASGTDSSATTSGEGSASQHDASTDVGDGVTDEAVLDWFQTLDEIIIMLLVSANADSQHISYKLTTTHLEVKERGLTLIQADLPFHVQVDDSNWQFDEYQGQKVIAVTLQKAEGDAGYADWPHYKVQA